MRYNKLVRDKIPEIIRRKGGIPFTHIADDREYKQKLREKLQEEVDEFLESGNQEELADILEVIEAICPVYHFKRGQLSIIQKKKAKEKGNFKKKIILETV